MNTNPAAVTVLCYGDSNVNGIKPDRSGRFAVDERWTGLLQKQLGEGYYVIEEGLGGRTTDLDHYNPAKPSRNGLEYFRPCLDTHAPLSAILIWLGTNDLKVPYARSPEDIAAALRQYPEHIAQYCEANSLPKPKIVLISPTYVDTHAPAFESSMPTPGVYDEVSAEKSHRLAGPIQQVAEEAGCVFFDAAQVAATGDDGIHMTLESHRSIADSLTRLIKEL